MLFNRYALLTAALLVSACSKSDKSGAGSKPESEAPWAPAKLTAVNGVPAPEIEAALKKRLAGAPPNKITDDQWGHAKRLYKVYGGNALWLAPDGLHSDRAYALANAVLQAEQDGMRMDAYPVGPLAQAIQAWAEVRHGSLLGALPIGELDADAVPAMISRAGFQRLVSGGLVGIDCVGESLRAGADSGCGHLGRGAGQYREHGIGHLAGWYGWA